MYIDYTYSTLLKMALPKQPYLACNLQLSTCVFLIVNILLTNYIPIGIETYGAWGILGHKLIKDIGKKLKDATGEPRSTFFLTQRISMAVQRGNSSCILNTVPPSMGLESIFEFISVDPENPENSDK